MVLNYGLTFSGTSAKQVTPKEGIAILFNDSNSHISIDVIDGQREGLKSHGKYELIPGKHTIRTRLYYRRGNVTYFSNNYVDYSFNAEPGTVLNVVCTETKSTWKMWIEDMSSGKRVSERVVNPVVETVSQAELERTFSSVRAKAEQGDVESQYALGLLYEKGEGVAQDSAASIQWYLKASGQGHATAQFSVGLGYDLGLGVAQDSSEAYVWFSIAAENGDLSAPLFRDENEKRLSLEMIEEAKVRIKQLQEEIRAKQAQQQVPSS